MARPDSGGVMSRDVLDGIDRCILCWLATVDGGGQPNVSPKEVFASLDSVRLVIANIASPRSVRNIGENPRVCVSFVDVFVQKGYKLLGYATVVPPHDSRFAELSAPLVPMTRGVFPILGVIEIDVTEVHSILAPSYRFVPGTTEQSQVVNAMKAYGVRAIE